MYNDNVGNRIATRLDVNGKYKGIQEWQNNADNQLLEITSDKGATYEYDANGHVSQKRSSLGEVTIYQYDVEGRLIQESSTWGKQTYYTYDALGNRISKGTATEYDRKLKTDMMSWMKATDREAQLRLEESDITLSDILTKLVKMPEFLSRCLPIKDRTWRINHEDNRRQVTEEKLKKAVDTTVMIDTIEYLNDYTQTYVSPLQEQYTTYDKKVKSSYQATNIYDNKGMAIGNDLDTYHQDGLKSNITQISKENGRLYSSNLYQEFGSSERRIQDQAGYRSQYHDNSADIHLRAREYNTTTGRFLQQDTVLGSLKNPTTQNKYIYGNNNPFMYRDDAGRFGWNDLVNGVKSGVNKVVKAVDKHIVKPVVNAVQSGVNWVNKNIIQPAVKIFNNVAQAAKNAFNAANQYASQAIQWAINKTVQGYNQVYNWIGQKFEQAQVIYQQMVYAAQETLKKAEVRIRKMCEEAVSIVQNKKGINVNDLYNVPGIQNIAKDMLGFNYNKSGDYYYTSEKSVQSLGGYGNFYEGVGPILGMDLDTDFGTFEYDGKQYRFQVWKGSYGYGNSYGAEIGLYTRNANNPLNGIADSLGEWYPCAPESDQIRMVNTIYDSHTNKKLIRNDTADYAENGTHYWNLAIQGKSGYSKDDLYTKGELYFANTDTAGAFAEFLRSMKNNSIANVVLDGKKVTYIWGK